MGVDGGRAMRQAPRSVIVLLGGLALVGLALPDSGGSVTTAARAMVVDTSAPVQSFGVPAVSERAATPPSVSLDRPGIDPALTDLVRGTTPARLVAAPSEDSIVGSTLLPPPPALFDPASVRFIGGPDGSALPFDYPDEVWAGALDGSDAERLPGVSGRTALVLAAGAAYSPARGEIWIKPPDEPARRIVTDAGEPFVVSADRRSIVVSRREREAGGGYIDLGVWRYPIDGTQPKRVLPPLSHAGERGELTVGPDGRSVASRPNASLDEPPPMQVRFGCSPPRRILGDPIGFTFDGDLIRSVEVFERYDPATGQSEHIVRGRGPVSVTPDGRHIIIQPGGSLRTRLVVEDAVTGERRRWRLAEGEWYYTALGRNRYAVLQDYETLVFAVIDLRQDWLGYVEFQGR